MDTEISILILTLVLTFAFYTFDLVGLISHVLNVQCTRVHMYTGEKIECASNL